MIVARIRACLLLIYHIHNNSCCVYVVADCRNLKHSFSHVMFFVLAIRPLQSFLLFFVLFRLMDANRDGFLNFKEVAMTFNALCKGDHVLKLRLFYCLHLPGVVLPGELDQRNKLQKQVDDIDCNMDEACDAEEFFDCAQKSLEKTAEELKQDDDDAELEVSKTEEAKKHDSGGGDTASLRSLQTKLFMTTSNNSLLRDKTKKIKQTSSGSGVANELKLPPLPRDYFVHLWKGLHDLIEFGNLDDTTLEGRQSMYHSVSVKKDSKDLLNPRPHVLVMLMGWVGF